MDSNPLGGRWRRTYPDAALRPLHALLTWIVCLFGGIVRRGLLEMRASTEASQAPPLEDRLALVQIQELQLLIQVTLGE